MEDGSNGQIENRRCIRILIPCVSTESTVNWPSFLRGPLIIGSIYIASKFLEEKTSHHNLEDMILRSEANRRQEIRKSLSSKLYFMVVPYVNVWRYKDRFKGAIPIHYYSVSLRFPAPPSMKTSNLAKVSISTPWRRNIPFPLPSCQRVLPEICMHIHELWYLNNFLFVRLSRTLH